MVHSTCKDCRQNVIIFTTHIISRKLNFWAKARRLVTVTKNRFLYSRDYIYIVDTKADQMCFVTCWFIWSFGAFMVNLELNSCIENISIENPVWFNKMSQNVITRIFFRLVYRSSHMPFMILFLISHMIRLEIYHYQNLLSFFFYWSCSCLDLPYQWHIREKTNSWWYLPRSDSLTF